MFIFTYIYLYLHLYFINININININDSKVPLKATSSAILGFAYRKPEEENVC